MDPDYLYDVTANCINKHGIYWRLELRSIVIE